MLAGAGRGLGSMTTTLSRTDATARRPRICRWSRRPGSALGAAGWGNAFYAAAAQAGSESWKAWFFGSSDASNFITVDKTPGALWVTGSPRRR